MTCGYTAGYGIPSTKERGKNNITYSGHSELGDLMRETATKVLPETDAKFWQILQQ